MHGRTYFFFNTLSHNQLHLLKNLVSNYRKKSNFFLQDEDTVIKQFILVANKQLKCSLQLATIEEILILK